MKVTLDINDRVWADFCLELEDDKNCGCGGDPSKHLSTTLGVELIRRKVQVYAYHLMKEGYGEQACIQLGDIYIADKMKEYELG